MTITIFNAVLAILVMIPALPLMFLIGLTIKLKDRGPVFYKGTRLGISKRPFAMYKFRTLPVGAQKTIGTDLFKPGTFCLSRFSKFLRDSRLDELPQLINILRGDMDFIGPRPVRPEVYDEVADTIRNYDLRFSVRPGLIGYAQLFTPHSAPKRLRALIDNKFITRKRKLSWDMLIISYTAWIIGLTALRKGTGHLTDLTRSQVFRFYSQTRAFDRVRAKGASVIVSTKDGTVLEDNAFLVDLNESHFKILSTIDLNGEDYRFVLRRTIRRGRRDRPKRSICHGKVYKTLPWKGNFKHVHIIAYEPVTPLNHYMVDQYFLKKSIV
ncbi:sugar transferase [Desulfovibrio ferrophilus]|uniref:sugar transferase n=1 Tax=Desulfovibrio ferrophilus TaxID=241368 RepID=UPI001561CD8F|nr:sugar transferase [Desulfovibrio ferrophilus]